MRILLDTHFLLWLAQAPEKLSPKAHRLLADEQNELYYSLVSLWEIGIKNSLNKPDFNVDINRLDKGLRYLGANCLNLDILHIIQATTYPPIHKDPFDRMLLAQADVEGLSFLTVDRLILKYNKPFIITD